MPEESRNVLVKFELDLAGEEVKERERRWRAKALSFIDSLAGTYPFYDWLSYSYRKGVRPIYCTVISLRSGTFNVPNASSYDVCVLDEDTTPLGSFGRRLDIYYCA